MPIKNEIIIVNGLGNKKEEFTLTNIQHMDLMYIDGRLNYRFLINNEYSFFDYVTSYIKEIKIYGNNDTNN